MNYPIKMGSLMKKSVFLFTFLIIFSFAYAETYSYEIDSYERNSLITTIKSVSEPYIDRDYIIFTAQKNARYIGISFGFEEFKTVHKFQRKIITDEDGKGIDSILFFIMPIPRDMKELTYRVVIDGQWTTDPQNNNKRYDFSTGMMLSVFEITRPTPLKTDKIPDGLVRFVFEDEPGCKIRIAGSFNNWDPFMYILKEVKPGIYQIDLPLPNGTYYYAFYKGAETFSDKTNPDKVFRNDGSIASIITIK